MGPALALPCLVTAAAGRKRKAESMPPGNQNGDSGKEAARDCCLFACSAMKPEWQHACLHWRAFSVGKCSQHTHAYTASASTQSTSMLLHSGIMTQQLLACLQMTCFAAQRSTSSRQAARVTSTHHIDCMLCSMIVTRMLCATGSCGDGVTGCRCTATS